jgi:hypothetical protein
MPMELFGFEIARKGEENETKNIKSPVPPLFDDGATEVTGAQGALANYGGYVVDMEGSAKNEAELVTRYRNMAMQPECDSAVEDIVNEAIVIDDHLPVDIILDDLEYSNKVKDRIRKEFYNVLKLLDFNNTAYELFRQWYVDGRLYHHIMIDEKKPREGIKELRKIDPRKIKKIREKKIEIDPRTKIKVEKGYNEYYVYNSRGLSASSNQSVVKMAGDSISHITSGLVDPNNKMVLGYLHKAIKPLNQLRMLEDATVIYRLARAPERRIFYIDVGNLPKMKAEQYLHDMMVKHKNKLQYDVTTGEIRDDRKFMTMLEDFWLPRREGGRGTEITTLPGGQNLGEMDDVDYFRRKLYKSLNVPITRMETENQFNLGRSTEITRDELKFTKFIKRLRTRFSILFDELLEVQLVLKGILTRKDWNKIKENLYYNFTHDNYFSELKEVEILRERLNIMNEIDPFVGKYYSVSWIRKNVLRMTEEEINDMDKEIKAEEEDPDSPMNFDDMENDEPKQLPPDKKPEEPEEPTEEEIEIPQEISEEEKQLIKSMTKFMDSMEPSENEKV